MKSMEHRKQLMKLLRQNQGHVGLWTVWSDFIEMGAIAISNAVDHHQRDLREARYLPIAKKYSPEEMHRFAQAMSALVGALEADFGDVLGSVFMELELSNQWAGQFFTPFELARMLARMQMDGLAQGIEERGFITVLDPAVGAGSLPIAFAEAMRDAGHNYQRCLHVTGQDIDARAAHMAYIQLSLLGVPAIVVVGNTLAGESREQWFTPAHVWGGWSWRLAARRSAEPAEPTCDPIVLPQPEEQLALFAA